MAEEKNPEEEIINITDKCKIIVDKAGNVKLKDCNDAELTPFDIEILNRTRKAFEKEGFEREDEV